MHDGSYILSYFKVALEVILNAPIKFVELFLENILNQELPFLEYILKQEPPCLVHVVTRWNSTLTIYQSPIHVL